MKNILLAVSGGIDSMYLANRASELFPGALLALAHCNFCLRGEESDGDEAFVRQWCEERGMECHVKRFDTLGYAEAHGLSTEMAARELRYGWFAQLCSEYGYEATAIAHNADDDAETLMLNLIRGTGLRGISGMGERPGIVRPLLRTSREEIRKWMLEHGCSWREDSTNAQSLYKRNVLRNEIFPRLRDLNPSLTATLCEDMERFAQAGAIVEDYWLDARERVLCGDGSIDLRALLGLKHWEYVLWRLLEGSGIRKGEFEDLRDALRSGRQIGGKRFGPVVATSTRLELCATSVCDGPELLCELLPREALSSLKQEEGCLVLDADKVPQPLRIRHFQPGDWMRPLGMGGRRKKLSDILKELGYTVGSKAGVRVLEIEGSHVGAILCSRIDETLKVDGTTSRVLRLKFKD
ncbi:MAG: tRNA lysidine(34) synthetase TilS [Candidatus Cryptobacteroides sp.]|nr:tRNA lysidine(34) synthetase TilS [Bacteroidales bacterium]MDY6158738.1 tRNA lysidine(34) synthetase TilS [Candidatus Cryptobacteroides sp.]